VTKLAKHNGKDDPRPSPRSISPSTRACPQDHGIRHARANRKTLGRPKRVFRRDEVIRLRDVEGLSWRILIRACREKLEKVADLKQYTTLIAMDDLEEVALGYKQSISLALRTAHSLRRCTYGSILTEFAQLSWWVWLRRDSSCLCRLPARHKTHWA
jgi:hypothetical protein